MVAFRPISGLVAWAAALGGVLYGLTFVVLDNVAASAALLLIGGLLTTLILVALGGSVASRGEQAARWAVGIGVIGAVGSLLHGGYDLANQIHPPLIPGAVSPSDLPSQVDPRGLATFGLVGLAFAALGALMRTVDAYPPRLAGLAVALGAIMIIIYLGRLIILDPDNPVVRLALAAGLIANTAFLGWLGTVWRRGHPAPA